MYLYVGYLCPPLVTIATYWFRNCRTDELRQLPIVTVLGVSGWSEVSQWPSKGVAVSLRCWIMASDPYTVDLGGTNLYV